MSRNVHPVESSWYTAYRFVVKSTDDRSVDDAARNKYTSQFVSANADVDLDGVVDIFDVNLISAHWGQKGPAAPSGAGAAGRAVSEPASIALVFLAAPLLLLGALRRKLR